MIKENKFKINKNNNLRRILCFIIIISIFFSTTYLVIIAAFNPSNATDMPCRLYTNEAKVVKINGFDIFYREIGDNNTNYPIVILHGGPGLSSYYFQSCFDFLKNEYRVIYYDQRGSGFSQIKSNLKYYNIENLVDDLESLRKEVIGKDKIILIGHSFGGLIAMKYAIDHEENIDKLILISPLSAKYRNQKLDINSIILKYGIPPFNQEAANKWFVKVLPYLFRKTFFYEKNASCLKIGYGSFATMKTLSQSIYGYDIREELSDLNVETLIIYGITEKKDYKKDMLELNRLINNSLLIEFNKSGHWCFLEEPDLFEKTIYSFLKN